VADGQAQTDRDARSPAPPPVGALLTGLDRLKRRLFARVAERCAHEGATRVLLFGDAATVRAHARQPWRQHGLTVVGACVVDDQPTLAPTGLRTVPRGEPTDADRIIVCAAADEAGLAARASAAWPGVPVLRIFGDSPDLPTTALDAADLVDRFGLDPADAAWLLENRGERHDATLPMLPAVRTEMHLRRYELACEHARGARALDCACGTGYGSAFLAEVGGARSVVGVDVDPRAVEYARRRHTRDGVRFLAADALSTGLPDASVDLVASFETIEHLEDDGPARLVAEFDRVLTPGGVLIVSTPNLGGPTAYHHQSLSAGELVGVVRTRLTIEHALGQIPGDEPPAGRWPAGIFPLDAGWPEPETLIVVARKPR
jgi:SAM-dependent methyltransferase